MVKAAIVQTEEHSADQPKDGGSIPTSPLHSIRVIPISAQIGKMIFEEHHYLHSLPGGTQMVFGTFFDNRLLGAISYGTGPYMAYRLVDGAIPDDCLTLSRLWLSDELPPNSESRVIGVTLRSLQKYTDVKFVISYADPSQGHFGCIYQATNWVYTGLSEATPLYDIGGSKPRHSRSLSHSFGTHSTEYLRSNGLDVKLICQARKHRYVYFLDRSWRSRLSVPVLPYPKIGDIKNANC